MQARHIWCEAHRFECFPALGYRIADKMIEDPKVGIRVLLQGT